MAEDQPLRVEEDEDRPAQTPERDEELSTDKVIRDRCLKLYKDIEKGYSDKWERSNAQMDYWDIYNCVLGPKQFYSGNSKIFVPIVHDAVNARKTRFVNQIFPQTGKHIEVTASEDKPTGLMSLLEWYIRKDRLRTRVMPALVRNGDVEGHYNLYVRWVRNERHVAQRVQKKRTIDAFDQLETEGDEYDDIQEQEIVHQYPSTEVLADADVLVLPATADSIGAAIENGGSVTILRRWSKQKIIEMIREGEIDKDEGQTLLASMSRKLMSDVPDKGKVAGEAAGVRMQGDKVHAVVYETWSRIKVEDEKRICRIYFGGETVVLGCKRNPYWCDKVPLLSAPVEKIQGAFSGASKIKFIDTMQYAANDAINEGMDAAAYALMPIIMTDPEKNPRTGSMVLNVAAIWETSPKDTQFAQFPPLWKDAFTIVQSAKEQIFQTLGVNPAMMPQQVTAPGKKPNQAQIANEQQVDLLTTADAVTAIEGEILTPLLQWYVWLDHQFRDKDILVPAFGEMGVFAEMEQIKPIQMDRRFEFRWFGVESARSMQQLQMKMAGINVLRGIPPQMYPGYELSLAPLIADFVESTYGSRMAPRIFRDLKHQLTMQPQFENELLAAGFDVLTHPLDNDQEHLQAHMQAMQAGDLSGSIRAHIMRHQQQMQQKQMAQMMQQQQMMQPQQPPQQGPGGRQPRPGGAATGPRPNGQGPAGMIHRDRIPLGMPRPRGAM